MQNGCTYQDFVDCGPEEGFNGESGALVYLEWMSRTEMAFGLSNCAMAQRVKYVTRRFSGRALSWWIGLTQSRGKDAAMSMSWNEFEMRTMEEFYPGSEKIRMEDELRNLRMIGADYTSYTNRFRELSTLVPYLVTPRLVGIERYIQGLSSPVQGMVEALRPETSDNAMAMVRIMTDEMAAGATSAPGTQGKEKVKRRKRRDKGPSSRCAKCTLSHRKEALCPNCYRCNRLGHLVWSCHEETRLETPVRVRDPTVNRVACFECGSQDHGQRTCPQRNGSAGQGTESTSEPIWGKTYVTDAEGSQWEIPILGMMEG